MLPGFKTVNILSDTNVLAVFSTVEITSPHGFIVKGFTANQEQHWNSITLAQLQVEKGKIMTPSCIHNQ